MNIKSFTLLLVGLLSVVGLHASELSDKLQSPNHVLLMRLALAPGIGDPTNYTLNDCSTQRNLNDEGKNHARLLDFNGHQVAPALASFFDEMHVAKKRNLELQKFIAHQIKTKGSNALIMVTHHVNIYEYVGENIASGDMVVAKVDAEGRMLSYQRISRPE